MFTHWKEDMSIKSDKNGRLQLPDFPPKGQVNMRDWAAKILEKDN